MEMFSTKLSGIAHCIVPKLSVDSVLIQPPIPLIPQMINPQLPIMMQPPSIVQIIVPASLKQNTAEEGMEHQNDQEKLPMLNITSTEEPVLTTTSTTTQETLPITSSTEHYLKIEPIDNSYNSEQIKLDERSNDIPVDRTVNYNAELIEPEEIPDVNQKL